MARMFMLSSFLDVAVSGSGIVAPSQQFSIKNAASRHNPDSGGIPLINLPVLLRLFYVTNNIDINS